MGLALRAYYLNGGGRHRLSAGWLQAPPGHQCDPEGTLRRDWSMAMTVTANSPGPGRSVCEPRIPKLLFDLKVSLSGGSGKLLWTLSGFQAGRFRIPKR